MSGSDPRKKDTHAKSPSDGTEENGVDVYKLPSIMDYLPGSNLIADPPRIPDMV
jgi:hypothetical protein